METDNPRDVQISQLTHFISCFDGEEVSHFRETIHDYPYGIIALLSSWKADNEIHTNFFPFPLGYRKRMKNTCWSLMFRLHTTAYVTFSNKFGDFPFHTGPPKPLP